MKNTKHVSRRNFVKKGTALALGGTLLSSLPSQLYGKAKEKVIKIGLVGCGNRGAGSIFEALNASPLVRVVALGDTFKDKVDVLHGRLKKEHKDQCDITEATKFVGFDAYKKVIELSDAVMLVTPPPFRPTHFEAVIQAGKHAFIEKPLAVDVPGFIKIIETGKLATQKNLNVVVGLHMRYAPPIQEMVKRIHAGEIGEITSINTYFNVGAPRILPREPQQTEMEYQMRNWRYFTWLWGGQLAGQAIHQIDVMNWVMKDFPVKAQGSGGRLSFSGVNQGNTYDHFFMEYEYANGIQMHAQGRTMDNCYNRMGWEIRGTKGIANEKYQFQDYSGKTFWKFREHKDDIGFYQEVQNKFIGSLLNGTYINNTEYGAKSTLTTLMGRVSAETGLSITLEEFIKSDETLAPNDMSWDSKSVQTPDENGNYEIVRPGNH